MITLPNLITGNQPCHLTVSGACSVAGGIFLQFKYVMVPTSRGPFPSRMMGTGVRLIFAHIGHIFFGICCMPTLCHLLREVKEVSVISRVDMLTLKPSF